MNLIVAVDSEWGIGKDGKLLYSIKEDMKFFRQTTLDKVVVMGRGTLESFPDMKPLPKRVNIVLSRNKDYSAEGVTVCDSVDELMQEINQYKSEDVFVIGGKQVYELLLGYCDTAYITKINDVREADTKLINIDNLNNWKCVYTSEIMVQETPEERLEYTFNTYKNMAK